MNFLFKNMKVLVIQQKMIGDVLTSSILLEALRNKYPNARLHYLINEHTLPVVKNNPYLNKYILFTKKNEASKLDLLKLALEIRKNKYDVVIDVYSKFSSNLISLLSSSKIKISKYKWYTHFIYTHVFNEESKSITNAGLAVENRIKLLSPLITSAKIYKPKIYLTKKEIESSRQFLRQSNINLDKPIYMISVLGSSKNKTYPLQYMAQIIDTIVNNTKAQILFNYIPNQKTEAKAVFNYCNLNTQKHIYFNVYGNSLRSFLAITSQCTALIGNEGGAVNMAKALNIPTFTIFSPWIKKEAWSMFDDGKKHVSTHLVDVNPTLYKNMPVKTFKKDYEAMYHHFKPDTITLLLNTFLKQF